MAWLRSKKALKHLRSHLGHIRVITECPAITDCPQQYHSIIKYLIPVFSTENPCSFALAHTRDSSSGHSGAQQPQTHPLQRTAGGDRPGGQSLYSGLQETQMQFQLVEIKAIFPQKCSSFYLEAVLGHSVSNWRVLCRLEQAQACVLPSVQGCLGSQGKQK